MTAPATLAASIRPYPEYSRANSYPWSSFPPRRAQRVGIGPTPRSGRSAAFFDPLFSLSHTHSLSLSLSHSHSHTHSHTLSHSQTHTHTRTHKHGKVGFTLASMMQTPHWPAPGQCVHGSAQQVMRQTEPKQNPFRKCWQTEPFSKMLVLRSHPGCVRGGARCRTELCTVT